MQPIRIELSLKNACAIKICNIDLFVLPCFVNEENSGLTMKNINRV